ncbi:hypothetical protein IQ238_07465 [Pleurocapsales cyanobacterium LEGE 06147]|nr:hypothetical protein [Pleurocapsales cyanobacterium LEGE 06147]
MFAILKKKLHTLVDNAILLDNIILKNSEDELIVKLATQERCPENLKQIVNNCVGNVWGISEQLALFLSNTIHHFHSKNVLEFGAGSSSLVLAHSISSIGGGKLSSIEQHPTWCAENWKIVQEIENVDSQMIVGKPKWSFGISGIYFSFKESCLSDVASRAPYDLVLIDSPQFFFGRDGGVPLIYDYLVPNALIILDDAGRQFEKNTLFRWLRSYPGLSLVYYAPEFGGKGLAVLRCHHKQSPQFSFSAFISGIRDSYSIFKNSEFKKLRTQISFGCGSLTETASPSARKN